MTTTKLSLYLYTPKQNGIMDNLLKRLEEHDAPITSEKWKNLCFDKSGKSYLDSDTFSSEKKALDNIVEAVNRFPYVVYSGFDLAWEIDSDDYSHTIQIPWK